MFSRISEGFAHLRRIVFLEFEDCGFQIVRHNQPGNPTQKLKDPTNGPAEVRRRLGLGGLRIQIPRGPQCSNEQLHLAHLAGIRIHNHGFLPELSTNKR